MNRRHFPHCSMATVAATALLGPAAARSARAGSVPDAIGIQLYSLRDVFASGVVGALEALHRMGYRELEFAGYADRPPAVLRALLDTLGLTAPAVHVSLGAVRADLPGVLDACHAVGHRFLVVPWLPDEERADLDGYRRFADEMNRIGQQTSAAGVRLAYHNHDVEFETFGTDRPAYDALVEALDPALVDLELDLYWVTKAGHDPVAYFERYPGRFPLWHVKDARGPENTMADVGAGDIDWVRLFAASETAGLRHAFVEHDGPADSLASAHASIDFLTSLRP